MRRILAPAIGTWLVLVVALSLAPVALADGRDPRCDNWELHGAPPGIDLATVCAPAAGLATAELDLGSEPLVPYIVGLLVMAAVLTVFGFVAMRLTAKPAAGPRARAAAWWTCAGCGSPNQPARATCFACHASRGDPAPTHPS